MHVFFMYIYIYLLINATSTHFFPVWTHEFNLWFVRSFGITGIVRVWYRNTLVIPKYHASLLHGRISVSLTHYWTRGLRRTRFVCLPQPYFTFFIYVYVLFLYVFLFSPSAQLFYFSFPLSLSTGKKDGDDGTADHIDIPKRTTPAKGRCGSPWLGIQWSEAFCKKPILKLIIYNIGYVHIPSSHMRCGIVDLDFPLSMERWAFAHTVFPAKVVICYILFLWRLIQSNLHQTNIVGNSSIHACLIEKVYIVALSIAAL